MGSLCKEVTIMRPLKSSSASFFQLESPKRAKWHIIRRAVVHRLHIFSEHICTATVICSYSLRLASALFIVLNDIFSQEHDYKVLAVIPHSYDIQPKEEGFYLIVMPSMATELFTYQRYHKSKLRK